MKQAENVVSPKSKGLFEQVNSARQSTDRLRLHYLILIL